MKQFLHLSILLAALAVPAVGLAQYDYYIVGDSTCILTKYTGSGGAVEIPAKINGRFVTSIFSSAFEDCNSLTSVVIPGTIYSIDNNAFYCCRNLTNVVIGSGVNSIGRGAFLSCTNLPRITIPSSVVSIAAQAFGHCYNLVSVVIEGSGTSIGDEAFFCCNRLSGIYFAGNYPDYGKTFSSPTFGRQVFLGNNSARVFYFPGTAGWGVAINGDLPVLWNPQVKPDNTLGVRDNCFGFTVTNAGNPIVFVEARGSLTSGAWVLLSTNTLTGGESYFSDPSWTNYTGRFYRFRAP
jgi:hypothetical protein